eukprot:3420534-Amphidinium_carterae.2
MPPLSGSEGPSKGSVGEMLGLSCDKGPNLACVSSAVVSSLSRPTSFCLRLLSLGASELSGEVQVASESVSASHTQGWAFGNSSARMGRNSRAARSIKFCGFGCLAVEYATSVMDSLVASTACQLVGSKRTGHLVKGKQGSSVGQSLSNFMAPMCTSVSTYRGAQTNAVPNAIRHPRKKPTWVQS